MEHKTKLIMPLDRARADYNAILKKYGSKVTSTQGYLRLEQELVSAQNTIEFDFLDQEGTIRPSEERLALTDVFYATEIGVFIMKITDADTGAGTEFGSVLDTFPNSITYSAANEARLLQYIYNGKSNIRIDNDVIIDGLDNMRFYRAGQAQEGVEVSVVANPNPAYIADEWNSASYGMYPMTPGVIFSGTAKNKHIIELPDSANMSGTASTNFAIVIYRGILVQNASGFYKEMQSKPGRF